MEEKLYNRLQIANIRVMSGIVGFVLGVSAGLILCLLSLKGPLAPVPCDNRDLLKTIHEQDSIIDKYTTYKNWFREVHGIDTTKMEQFRHKVK